MGVNQLITTAGYTLTLDVKKMGDPLSQAEDFIEKVNQLSGDFIEPITCENLKEKSTYMAYFGSKDRHEKYIELIYAMNQASMAERYKFPWETIPFYNVKDEECATEFEVDPAVRTVLFKAENYEKPFVFAE